jgi:hypothetical protein
MVNSPLMEDLGLDQASLGEDFGGAEAAVNYPTTILCSKEVVCGREMQKSKTRNGLQR